MKNSASNKRVYIRKFWRILKFMEEWVEFNEYDCYYGVNNGRVASRVEVKCCTMGTMMVISNLNFHPFRQFDIYLK